MKSPYRMTQAEIDALPLPERLRIARELMESGSWYALASMTLGLVGMLIVFLLS